jgi:serine/threonine-protein phosphatase 4 regulatory subunit 1
MEFICLSDEVNAKLRKTVAASLGRICRVVSQTCLQTKLFPVYRKLAADHNYGVRRAAADSIADIARASEGEFKLQVATVGCALVADAARWVKVSMMAQVGPLIAALAGVSIPSELVNFFISLVAISGEGEGDGRLQCAYNFPAVLLTLGRENWADLSHAYHQLTNHNEQMVRKCMASSLHEVARIIGPELAESELVQTFRDFFSDLEAVRLAAFRDKRPGKSTEGSEGSSAQQSELASQGDAGAAASSPGTALLPRDLWRYAVARGHDACKR